MKSIYISGPYSADTEEKKLENVERASEMSMAFAEQGYAPFCPHLMSKDWEHLTDLEYDDFLIIDLYWLEKCDIIYMLPGWETSEGAWVEHLMAKASGLEVWYG